MQPDASNPEEDSQPPPKAFPVVGIGASAGGLEAVRELLEHLSMNTGMAYVLVHHLDPRHESALTELLSKATMMPVCEATQGVAVEPDHVYIIPPNASIELKDGKLQLTRRVETRRPHMPVDHFLRSLSKERQSQAIAVILSGSASDGALGLTDVKASGGVTFAQDETAKYDGMPRCAIGTGQVDLVLPPKEIAEELARIARHPYLGRPQGEEVDEIAGKQQDGFLQILGILHHATNIDFALYKHGTLKRRIARRMALQTVETIDDYARRLRADPSEVEDLYRDLLINVTGFFRDPDAFDALKTVVFPQIMRERAVDDPVRMWIPGCSTGEEVYSIAISLLEFLDDRAGVVPIKLFATDISEDAIEKGRRGFYLENISQDVSPERLRRFFLKSHDGYEVAKSIRELCVFARHDLTRDPPFSNLDLISCRNVLIYFGPTLQKRVVPLFHYSLKPSGFLMLGASEAVGQFSTLFSIQEKKHKIYTKKPASIVHAFDLTTRDQRLRRGVPLQGQGDLTARPGAAVKKEVDLLLEKYSPAGVVVNQNLKIIQVRGNTGPYLKLAPGEVSVDVLKMAKEGLLPGLSKALEEVQRSGRGARKEGLRVAVRPSDDQREINLEVLPLQTHDGDQRCFLILFEDREQRASDAGTLRGEFRSWLLSVLRRRRGKEAAKEPAEIERLREELEGTESYLLSVTQEQEATNEELRAANEETLSANEELLSTNEELETAKEELQATNEELSTVNDELRIRNVETARINDDLTNLLASVDIPIIMLGSDLCIRRFTPSAAKVLNFIASDIGRPLGDLRPKINVPDLESLLEEVLEKFCTREREVQDEDGHWHHMYIRPYRTLEKRIDGAVIALVDIDKLKRNQQDLQRLVAVVKDSNDAITVHDTTGRIIAWNRGAERMYGYTETEALAMNIQELLPEDSKNEAKRLFSEVAEGNEIASFETKRVTKDGRVLDVWLAATVLADETGLPERLATTERDITARKHAERALREEGRLTGEKLNHSEKRTQAILETAAEAIITIDEGGIVDSVNPAAERMFGYTQSEVVGKNVKLLMPEPYRSEHDSYIRQYLDTGTRKILGAGREVEGRRMDGRTFPAHLSVSEVKLGQRRAFTGFIRDISELKEAYGRMLQSERLAAIGEAMTGLAHEGRNALQQSQASLEMLARRVKDRPDALGLIAELQQAQDELHRLYEEVRQYAAPLRVERRLCDLEALVEEVWDDLRANREGRATQLRQINDGSHPRCEIDRTLFRRVVRNIIENSLAARQDDVEVEVQYSEAGSSEAPAVRLVIRDNGPGLTDDGREKIFDAFYTTKTQGTGLGMAIAKRIVEGHGGQIEVGPQEETGTAIVITLPRRKP